MAAFPTSIVDFLYTAADKKGVPSDVFQKILDEVVAMQTALVNGRARCSAYHNAIQIVDTATATALNFNSEDFDVGSMHDNVTNNTRVTIPAGNAGIYMVVGGTSFSASATGYRLLKLQKNSVTNLANTIIPVSSSAVQTDVQVVSVVSLAAGDFIQLIAVHTAGVFLNIGSATREEASFLQVVRMW